LITAHITTSSQTNALQRICSSKCDSNDKNMVCSVPSFPYFVNEVTTSFDLGGQPTIETIISFIFLFSDIKADNCFGNGI